MKKLSEPFDVTYTISFSGRTKGDGVPTVTAPMIRDKILAVLEDVLARGFIRDWSISAVRNNLAEAQEVIAKSEKDEY